MFLNLRLDLGSHVAILVLIIFSIVNGTSQWTKIRLVKNISSKWKVNVICQRKVTRHKVMKQFHFFIMEIDERKWQCAAGTDRRIVWESIKGVLFLSAGVKLVKCVNANLYSLQNIFHRRSTIVHYIYRNGRIYNQLEPRKQFSEVTKMETLFKENQLHL